MTAGRQKSLKLPKGTKKVTAEPASKSWTLKHRIRPPGASSDAIEAVIAVKGLAHNAVTTAQFSQSPFGVLALTECVEALHEAVTAVLLMAQMQTESERERRREASSERWAERRDILKRKARAAKRRQATRGSAQSAHLKKGQGRSRSGALLTGG